MLLVLFILILPLEITNVASSVDFRQQFKFFFRIEHRGVHFGVNFIILRNLSWRRTLLPTSSFLEKAWQILLSVLLDSGGWVLLALLLLVSLLSFLFFHPRHYDSEDVRTFIQDSGNKSLVTPERKRVLFIAFTLVALEIAHRSRRLLQERV